MRVLIASPTNGRYGRTDEESWLRTRDHLSFRNARAHIRDFPVLDSVRARIDAGAAS